MIIKYTIKRNKNGYNWLREITDFLETKNHHISWSECNSTINFYRERYDNTKQEWKVDYNDDNNLIYSYTFDNVYDKWRVYSFTCLIDDIDNKIHELKFNELNSLKSNEISKRRHVSNDVEKTLMKCLSLLERVQAKYTGESKYEKKEWEIDNIVEQIEKIYIDYKYRNVKKVK